MIFRVRLEQLILDLGFEQLNIPSLADKVFDLNNMPIPPDKIFEGKQLLVISPFEVAVKWGFHGGVESLRQKLIDDPELDSASTWTFIDSSSSSPSDIFEAFLNGKEVPMKGRAGFIVER